MAVENKYVNAAVVNNSGPHPMAGNNGSDLVVMVETFEIAAADDDGSVYRVFKSVPAGLIPLKIDIMCDAITGATDTDLGFYDSDFGGVIVKDALMDGQTLASALTRATGAELGLSKLNIDQAEKKLWELAGHTDKTRRPDYDICLTANTVGSADGTVTIRAFFAKSN